MKTDLPKIRRLLFLKNDAGFTFIEATISVVLISLIFLAFTISILAFREWTDRSWTIRVGTRAPQAAGVIHSDFERGFIRAEIISYEDYIACGSEAVAKEKGIMRLEGKEYVVKDGDCINFRFNV